MNDVESRKKEDIKNWLNINVMNIDKIYQLHELIRALDANQPLFNEDKNWPIKPYEIACICDEHIHKLEVLRDLCFYLEKSDNFIDKIMKQNNTADKNTSEKLD